MTSVASSQSNRIEVAPAGSVNIEPNQFPWLSAGASVSLTHVILPSGEEFRYGSVISLHNGVKKIADQVASDKSESTQRTLFSAMPMLMNGTRHPNVVKTYADRPDMPRVFSVCANMSKMPRLLVAVLDHGTDDPAVIRLGISNPKDHNRLVGMIGIAMPNQSAYRR